MDGPKDYEVRGERRPAHEIPDNNELQASMFMAAWLVAVLIGGVIGYMFGAVSCA
jgi:hypothetical protein